ncbi:MAG: adenosine kinase, partial [Mesorhizobium sp.]
YTQGRSLKHCGDLGSLAAGLVIQQIGPRPRQNLRHEAEQAGLI